MLSDTIIEAVGAAASLAAVFYARSTVMKSNAAADQFKQAQEAAKTQHNDGMKAQQTFAAEERQVRYEEKLERVTAFAADMTLRRIDQAQEISRVLLELINVASSEYRTPAPILTGPNGADRMTTKTTAVAARLRVAVSTLVGLGGPDLRRNVPRASDGQPDESLRLWQDALSMLVVVDLLLPDGDPRFMIEAPITGIVGPPEAQS